MIDRMSRTLLAALAGLILTALPAAAHPHVFVTIKSEIVYDANGSMTGIRHAWTFDDMYSTFATQGLESKEKGVFTREELAPLAEVNITSLKEFDFFTSAKTNGKKEQFGDPTDYWLEYKDTMLTLHFVLPVKSPVKARALELAIYDPTYFVDFSLAEKEPIVLASAPSECKLNIVRPQDANAAQGKRLGEAFFSQLDSSNDWGAQFASRISVRCS